MLRSRPPAQTSSLRELIQSNGGQLDATTDYESTLYSFNVEAAATKTVLKAWARVLGNPELSVGMLREELRTLDQEFALRSRDRRWRERDALKAVVAPGHSFKHWHPGSSESLAA